MDELEPEPVKVVLLGESGVGKTSIISQFTSNQFNPRVPTSVSAKFVSKIIDFPKYNKKIKFDIWDTVGQEKYRSLAKIFYKDAKIIVFVFDITKRKSFEGIKDFWYNETQNNADNNPILAIVGNKIDLYNNRDIDIDEGQAYADEIRAIFQTTSALSNSGISNLFNHLGKKFFIPEYNYKSGDKEAQENYMRKKKEEKKGILIRKKEEKEDKRIKLENNDNGEEEKKVAKKKCC
jgi:small GTP-binding protein